MPNVFRNWGPPKSTFMDQHQNTVWKFEGKTIGLGCHPSVTHEVLDGIGTHPKPFNTWKQLNKIRWNNDCIGMLSERWRVPTSLVPLRINGSKIPTERTSHSLQTTSDHSFKCLVGGWRLTSAITPRDNALQSQHLFTWKWLWLKGGLTHALAQYVTCSHFFRINKTMSILSTNNLYPCPVPCHHIHHIHHIHHVFIIYIYSSNIHQRFIKDSSIFIMCSSYIHHIYIYIFIIYSSCPSCKEVKWVRFGVCKLSWKTNVVILQGLPLNSSFDFKMSKWTNLRPTLLFRYVNIYIYNANIIHHVFHIIPHNSIIYFHIVPYIMPSNSLAN